MARKRSRRHEEQKETSDNEVAPLLVTFNVGGTKYQVSRSLLDQHPDIMLTRMVSDTWHAEGDEANNEFFIERDGARFAYVLDYMRDGRVSLPGGNTVCTKSSLLNELTYFGFKNVDKSSVEVEFSHGNVTKYVARLTEDFVRERDELVKSRDNLNLDIACLIMAHGVCVRRLKSESEKIEFVIAKGGGRIYEKTGNELDSQVINAVNATSLIQNKEALDKTLLKYGLKVSDYCEEVARSGSYYKQISAYNTNNKSMVPRIIKVRMTVNSIV